MSNAHEDSKAANGEGFSPTYESDGDGNQVLRKDEKAPVMGEIEHR